MFGLMVDSTLLLVLSEDGFVVFVVVEVMDKVEEAASIAAVAPVVFRVEGLIIGEEGGVWIGAV